MTSTSIRVIAIVSRPDRLANVLANFERQKRSAELLLVLNGAARQLETPIDARVTGLYCEGGSPARARNAGLDFVQMSGGGMVAFWDDDDYYGPGYLVEVAHALEGNRRRVVGKVIRYAEFDDGICLFAGRQGPAFLGGTMAGWAEELPPIPDLPCHEDHEWCRLLKRDGFELTTLSGAHYLYNRKAGEHAWRSTRTQMLHCYGPAFDLGRAEPSVVSGPLPHCSEFTPRATLDDVERELIRNLLARPVDSGLLDAFN